MSREKFSDDCPGCRPVIFDPKTGVPIPNSDPAAKAMMRAWQTTTRAEREAFHKATCLNSRDPLVLATVNDILHRMRKRMAAD